MSFCRESLEVAAQRLAAKDERIGPIDSKLFLIRHLIVLKDLTDSIKLSLGDTQVDEVPQGMPYSFPTSDIAHSIIVGGDGFFGSSLFRSAALLGSFAYLGVPKLLSGTEMLLVSMRLMKP